MLCPSLVRIGIQVPVLAGLLHNCECFVSGILDADVGAWVGAQQTVVLLEPESCLYSQPVPRRCYIWCCYMVSYCL